ncbi:MAG: hypothetical protein R2699_18725 [Acidimicrobiales bacterium]|nr:hypothetical protein [Acidimicrobiales bacterium]MCB1251588.1 hypothetical protein [Acidimicrobiales bacterium]MCB1259372.1 hypothetical protein [Acidimicrobiales bacterium]
MTETRQAEIDVINEALAIIDRGLTDIQHRELVSTLEVADLLLDVRTLLATDKDAEVHVN